MRLLIYGIILAIVPLVGWILQYWLSFKSKKLGVFRRHTSAYYLDFLFVPFNFLFVYSFVFDLNLILIAILSSFTLSLFIHIFWFKLHKRTKKEIYLFDLINKRLTYPGFIHFVYLWFQLSLVILFLISSSDSIFSYFSLLFLAVFFFCTIPASRVEHGKVKESDFTFLVLGLVILLTKLFFLIL